MPSEADVKALQERLQIYRANLAHYLNQQAMLGSAYAPPAVMNGIREARESIHQLKRTLRSWNVRVEDHPDDGDIGAQTSSDQGATIVSTTAIPTSTQDLEQFDRNTLRQILSEYFSSDELFDMLFEMNIDWENLPGSGKSAKVRELIMYVQRRNMYAALVRKVKELRPALPVWRAE